MTPTTRPCDMGLRPAPAWAPPGRFWLAWPAATGDRNRDDSAREDCLGLAEMLSDHAPVSLICSSRDAAEVALRTPPNVAALAADHDGGALRRHAPLWLLDADGRLAAGVAFSALGRELVERAGIAVLDPPPGLPAGLECDGEGTVLAAVAPERRPAAESALRQWLGVECPIWLEAAEDAAQSPGARFLAPGLVVLPPHPANHQALEAVIDARGRRLTLLELPDSKKGERCYADCLVGGGAVVVPDFEDGRGTEAFGQVNAFAKGRRVSAFPASWLAPDRAGLGAVVVVQPG